MEGFALRNSPALARLGSFNGTQPTPDYGSCKVLFAYRYKVLSIIFIVTRESSREQGLGPSPLKYLTTSSIIGC